MKRGDGRQEAEGEREQKGRGGARIAKFGTTDKMQVCTREFANFGSLETYAPPKTTTVVFSFCTHADAIYEALRSLRSDDRLFVVSKCGNRLPLTNVSTRNVGRVDHSYLTYITRHYHDLADATLFVKDSWTRQGDRDLFSRVPHLPLEEMRQRSDGFQCGRQYLIWHDCSALGAFRIDRYSKAWDRTTTGVRFKSRFASFHEFHRNMTARWSAKHSCAVCYGGVFAARRERIRRVPLATWEALRTSLERGDNIEESHFVERLWAMLLSDPLPHPTDRLLRKRTAMFSSVTRESRHTMGVRRSCLEPTRAGGDLTLIILGSEAHSLHHLMRQRPNCIVYARVHVEHGMNCTTIVRRHWSTMSFLRYTTPRTTNLYSRIHLLRQTDEGDGAPYTHRTFDRLCWSCIWSTIDTYAVRRRVLDKVLPVRCSPICRQPLTF